VNFKLADGRPPHATLAIEAASAETQIAEYFSRGDILSDRIFLRAVMMEILRKYWDVVLGYIVAYSTMGVVLAMVGPTMLVLGRQVGASSTASMSLTYIGRAVGFFVGSIVGGQIADRLGPRWAQILLCVSIVCSGLVTLLFPLTRSLLVLIFVAGLSTFFSGVLDNIALILLMRVCGRYGDPMIQALYSGFAIGSFLGPFAISFFLTEVEPKDQPLVSTFYKSAFYALAGYMFAIAALITFLTLRRRGPFGPHVYAIQAAERVAAASALGLPPSAVAPFAPGSAHAGACLTPFVAVPGEPLPPGFTPPEDPAVAAATAAAIADEETGVASLSALDPTRTGAVAGVVGGPGAVIASDADSDGAVAPARGPVAECLSFDWVVRRKGFNGSGGFIVMLMAALLFCYVGTQVGFGHYVAPYANERGFYSDDIAAFLASVFYGSFALGRLVGIPVSLYVQPRIIASYNIAATSVVIAVMVLFTESMPVLWVGSAFLGFCMATLYAACIMWLDSYIVFSGSVLSVIVVAVSVSDALIPMACGAAFELPAGPVSMMYLLTGLLILCAVMFAVITVYLKRTVTAPGDNGRNNGTKAGDGVAGFTDGVELSDLSSDPSALRGVFQARPDDE
jgi:MFS family permease